MRRGLIASASIQVNAPVESVWNALINPELIKKYMFGTEVVSEWKEGSPIAWKGKWEGKAYEDKGVILKMEPCKKLEYTHFSPLSGVPDSEENYHHVAFQISVKGNVTVVSISQDNNSGEKARTHSRKNWEKMLVSFKNIIEQ